ncbi:MAG: phosphodiester glycosidase family protein [Candidatus Marinimicrobia bacterium]|nr:phosphodiester glycosidase family protein [Candidatus Neomarinimicrobiota bacterium]
MKKCRIFILVLFLFAVSCSTRELVPEYRTGNIGEHIRWQVIKSSQITGAPLAVNILDIDLSAFEGMIDIAWRRDALVKTSVMARERKALAAVNGSFFDMRVGGAVVYLQVDGRKVAENHDRHAFSNSGAYTLDTSGTVMILKKPDRGWEYSPAFEDVMASGPLMIYRGAHCDLDSIPFNLRRHPRTAAGITGNDHLLLLTADGRTKHSAGMTIPELRDYMDSLGCTDALNLDGGGSTTMYIRGKTPTGVVNCPSDNGRFDHDGERRVANAVIVLE